jgi:hypothetical protein
MHINTMLTLTANLEWPKVLRYELLFFRTHQTSKSTTIWAKVDTSLYVTAGLNSHIERLDHDNSTLPCLRYNWPGKGCDSHKCWYAHICNADPTLCRSSYPAFECPMVLQNDRRDEFRDDGQDYKQNDAPYNPNPNSISLEQRIHQR